MLLPVAYSIVLRNQETRNTLSIGICQYGLQLPDCFTKSHWLIARIHIREYSIQM